MESLCGRSEELGGGEGGGWTICKTPRQTIGCLPGVGAGSDPRSSRLYEMFGSGGAICILSLAPVSSEEGESSLRDQLSFEINYLKKKNRKRERDARCQIIIITLMIKK